MPITIRRAEAADAATCGAMLYRAGARPPADLDWGSHDPRQDIEARQSLTACPVRPGGLGRADQAKELGAPRTGLVAARDCVAQTHGSDCRVLIGVDGTDPRAVRKGQPRLAGVAPFEVATSTASCSLLRLAGRRDQCGCRHRLSD